MITKVDLNYETMSIKEMSNIEIKGAILTVYEVIREYEDFIFGESFSILEQLDNNSYYCSKHLNFQNDIFIDNMYISSIFMIESNKEDLFAIASYNENFENDFIVRI